MTKARVVAEQLGKMGLEDLYTAPGHLIRRCQQIAAGIFFDEMAEWKVTPVQYASLIAIRENPGIDQSALASTVATDRSTIGAMLRSMDDRGLIRRETPPENLRIKQIFILPAGEQLLDESREAIYQVQERILAPFDSEEREMLLHLLTRAVSINNEFSRAPLRPEIRRVR